MEITNSAANSPLGLASRKLAFALVEEVGGANWKDRNIDRLQESLFLYGKAIVNGDIDSFPNGGLGA